MAGALIERCDATPSTAAVSATCEPGFTVLDHDVRQEVAEKCARANPSLAQFYYLGALMVAWSAHNDECRRTYEDHVESNGTAFRPGAYRALIPT